MKELIQKQLDMLQKARDSNRDILDNHPAFFPDKGLRENLTREQARWRDKLLRTHRELCLCVKECQEEIGADVNNFSLWEYAATLKDSEIDLIFTVAVYYHCDVSYPGKRAQKALVSAKIGPYDAEDLDREYSAWSFDIYKEILKYHVAQRWPMVWQWAHDYWGAEGLFKNPGMKAPTEGGYYVGDTQNQMMWFSSMQAFREYTEKSLEEIYE